MSDKSKEDNKPGEEKPKKLKICAQCGKNIEAKSLLRALDQFWHEECLKCSYCSTQLSELSLKFYFKRELILCKRDYIRPQQHYTDDDMTVRARSSVDHFGGEMIDQFPCPFNYFWEEDLKQLFGTTGICSQCLKTIPPLDMVMRAGEHIYHLECFACQVCRYRFCVGDKFYLHFNSVLCEDHYFNVKSYLYAVPFFT